jgi:hypothetical protein
MRENFTIAGNWLFIYEIAGQCVLKLKPKKTISGSAYRTLVLTVLDGLRTKTRAIPDGNDVWF